MRRFIAHDGEVAVAEHFLDPHIIERRAGFAGGVGIFHKSTAIGISPVLTRSPAGSMDSTRVGFIAANSRMYLSALSLVIICASCEPLNRRDMKSRIGHH